MKFGKPGREHRGRLRSADVRAEREDPDLMVFHPEYYFTPEEWSNLANKVLDNLTNSEREQNEWFRVENFLSSCLALQFLRPEQLKIIRASDEAKGIVRTFFIGKPEMNLLSDDEFDAAVMALWLFPDINLPMLAEAWENLKGRTKHHPTPLNQSMVFLLEPDLKQEMQMDEVWLLKGEAALTALKQDDGADPFSTLRLGMSLRLAHPFQGERKVLAAKRIKQTHAEEGQFSVPARDSLERVLNIHAAALARITLAEKVEIRDGQFVLHDSLPKLEEKTPLPTRPEV